MSLNTSQHVGSESHSREGGAYALQDIPINIVEVTNITNSRYNMLNGLCFIHICNCIFFCVNVMFIVYFI